MIPEVKPTRVFGTPIGELTLSTELKSGGVTLEQSTVTHALESVAPLTGRFAASVTIENSDSRCVNYNTTKVSVTVTIPCDPTEVAIERAKEYASRKVKEYMDQEKELVGGTFTEQFQAVSVPAPISSPPPLRPILQGTVQALPARPYPSQGILRRDL